MTTAWSWGRSLGQLRTTHPEAVGLAVKPEEPARREFLFGADRTAPGRVAGGLADLPGGHFFYREAGLQTSHEIDQVLPWRLNRDDDLFNLGADRHCHAGKRDRLVAEHVDTLQGRLGPVGTTENG